ncbi:MAG TPA: AAA family ATPase, partial [Tepidisphaeraceae bacterium]
SERDRRPVLLVGPSKVGKTAIVHEAVFRRVASRTSPHARQRNVWLLSPARLISGMSYVGQWEGRLLAILRYAAKREHVLYFDDVLGLYHAGQSADSDLSVAAVMRPWVERRDFRLLAEMTPEGFSVLREQDRAMADLFHVLPVREPPEPQTRRTLIHVLRAQEDRHNARFDLDALPTVMDLQRRYVRDQSMPGKASGFLAQLALKYRGGRDVTRATVLAEFASRSGLSVSFLDAAARLERCQVIQSLARDIIGQDAALGAMADIVTIAKARLNDPGRPLGTLLFLGPTGVGKTAAAKALAKYLYGDESRLLRFDMNEYVDAASVARLIGTFARPEGLLASAVRRQPYCVLLLDEIEKAHPAVFDLLLQVLGEGRLTDALGRTSDVTSGVVIMTSNLGTREAAASFGLRPATTSRHKAFIDAAQSFFRPEFFNRIDRIVPFEPLGREQVAAIANRLIADLFRREGLVHRRCVLDVDPAAMDRIVAEGYHPHLGARALKRAIERRLTTPIAAKLTTLSPETPTVVSIFTSGDTIAPHVQSLVNVAPLPPLKIDERDIDATLARVEEFVNQIEAANAAAEQRGAAIRLSADALSAAHFRYFAIREQIQRIDRMIQQIDHAIAQQSNPTRRTPRVKPQRRLRTLAARENGLAELLATGDVHRRLAELAGRAAIVGESPRERLTELLQECAQLQVMAATPPGADRVLLHIHPITADDNSKALTSFRDAYRHLFARQHGFSATILDLPDSPGQFILLEMPAIARLIAGEAGTHLLHATGETVTPVQLMILPLSPEQDPQAAARQHLAARRQWRHQLATGRSSPDDDPWPLGPVIRIADPALATLDLRSGLLCDGLPRGDDLRRFALASLPIPETLLSR